MCYMRAVGEENIAQGILIEDQTLISFDTEEEMIMAIVPPQTMRD